MTLVSVQLANLDRNCWTPIVAKMKKITRVKENIDIIDGIVRSKVPTSNFNPKIRGINLVTRIPLMILIFEAAM
jgi:hypothetical protein